jgi:radical SAM superfamily enzyme YgiQ (UPF0313 family)
MPRRRQELSRRELLDAEEGRAHRQAEHRIALCYPSPYRAAMSSLGYQTIYRLLNSTPGFAADRAILPDDVSAARELRTLESDRNAGSYPVMAFSVAYELELSGVIDCLRLAGLEPLRRNRKPSDPIVIAGGPLTFSNPVPLAPFFDLLLIGEGEDLILDFAAAARDCEYDKERLREHFSGVSGFAVPTDEAMAPPSVHQSADHHLPAHSQILTPHTELRSMFLIEAARGCSRGCTYCVMRRTTNGGMRIVDTERIIEAIPQEAKRVGLVGAAVTDHPQIEDIVERVVRSGREVGISSLRADKLNDNLVSLLARGGYRTLTVALDAPSQRLRDAIERRATEKILLESARLARDHRLRTLKIYMIFGLPGETEADIDELIRFCHELNRVHPRIALGIAPFVAKRHTPMDGEPFAGIQRVDQMLKRLRRGLRGAVEVRPTSARWAWVEHMLAQGDERTGEAVLKAHDAGGRFADYKRAFAEDECVPIGPLARVPSSREIASAKKEALRKRLALLP